MERIVYLPVRNLDCPTVNQERASAVYADIHMAIERATGNLGDSLADICVVFLCSQKKSVYERASAHLEHPRTGAGSRLWV